MIQLQVALIKTISLGSFIRIEILSLFKTSGLHLLAELFECVGNMFSILLNHHSCIKNDCDLVHDHETSFVHVTHLIVKNSFLISNLPYLCNMRKSPE